MSEVVFSLKLNDPINSGSEIVDELKFAKPVAKHFWKLKLAEPSMGDFLEVASRMCGQELHIMESLSPRDMMEVNAYMGKLFPASLETGEKR